MSEPRARIGLTQAGRGLCLAAALWVAAGLAMGRPPVVLLGGLPLTLIAWSWARARAAQADLERSVVRIQEADGELRVRLGRELVLPVLVEVSSRVPLGPLSLEPAAVEPTRARVEEADAGVVLVVTPTRIGDAFVQGVVIRAPIGWGLFEARAFRPAAVRVAALPRHFPLRGEAPLIATRTSIQERTSVHDVLRRGLGFELRELRDHQPGDPFKRIAWQATARRGKLIVRELESDLRLATWVAVDASPSMFWGPPGKARIDFALETAYNLFDVVLQRGDRAGLLVHDDRVLCQVRPSANRGQKTRLLDALSEVPHMNHEHRTELTDRELVEATLTWFELHEGRSFRLPEELWAGDPKDSGADESRLIAAARDWLAAQASRRGARRRPIELEALAGDQGRAALRAFSRAVGIPLPLDPTPRPGGQSRGIEAALEAILDAPAGPYAILLITDFATADDLETLRRVAIAARRKRHALVVFSPSDPEFEGSPAYALGPLERAVLTAHHHRVSQHLALAQVAMRPAGATFLRCGPQDVLPRLLRRLRQVA
jgi:uncharacterized protein (DUF58 family)